MQPKDFPSCNTVFYYCNKWKQEGVFEELMGRKEHIVVDTLGLPMSVVVHEANVHDSVGAEFTVVLQPDESSKKFSVLPLRWIVERSFSWPENFRRIAMDYEFYSDSGETMVQLAFCRLMYNKLCD